jgi:hypothetical protein
MECVLDQQINFMAVSNQVRKQRRVIQGIIRELSHNHVVHPGIDFWHQKGNQRIPLNKIVGLERTNYQSSKEIDSEQSQEELHAKLESWLRKLERSPDSWPFRGLFAFFFAFSICSYVDTVCRACRSKRST